jgi:hypothetical protein
MIPVRVEFDSPEMQAVYRTGMVTIPRFFEISKRE